MIVSIQQPIFDRMVATDTLANAIRHLRKEFRMDMTRDEANSNLKARAILLRCENKVIDEAEGMLGVKTDNSQRNHGTR